MESQWKHKVFTVNDMDFEPLALEIFRFQYAANPVYHAYVNALRINVPEVKSIIQIPFLPVSFFKSHAIQTTAFDPVLVFESSGTTGSVNSLHLVKDSNVYKESFTKGFEGFYGPINDWCIIGLLPSYLERGNSSLVYMVNELIALSLHPQSGFYLQEYDKLYARLISLEKAKQKTILIGVTFALLDFAEKYYPGTSGELFKHTIVMETGGMKGRKKEMIRREVHDVLKKSFKVTGVHSEYGMTELLSQAYSKGEGIFRCPPWMKVLVRDEEDPFAVSRLPIAIGTAVSSVIASEAKQRQSSPDSYRDGNRQAEEGYSYSGVINIIDLANIYSCSFIATDDAGRLYPDGSFEVLGRMDNSDLRGCSLLTV